MKKILLYTAIILSFTAKAQDVVPVIQSGHSGSIMYVEWDNTGRYIASVDDNNEVVINDIIAGKVFYRTKFPGNDIVLGIEYDEDGTLNIASRSKTMVFNPSTLKITDGGKRIARKKMSGEFKIKKSLLKKGDESLFNRNAFIEFTFAKESPDHKFIVAGDENGGLYFCNSSLKLESFESVHNLPINDIDFSADGTLVAVASADRSISIWRLPQIKMEKRLIPRSFNISAIASSSNNDSFVFGDELGYAYRLKFEHDKITCDAVDCHGGQVNDIEYTANDNVVATGGSDNSATIVDFENKVVLQKFKLQNSAKKTKQVFDINAIQEQALSSEEKKVWYDENVYSVAVSNDGKYLVYSGGKWGQIETPLKFANISDLNILGKKEERTAKKGKKNGLSVPNNMYTYKQMFFDENNNIYGLGESDKIFKYKSGITGFLPVGFTDISEVTNACKNNANALALNLSIEPTADSDYLIMTDLSTGDTYTCNGYDITRTTQSGKTVKYQGHLSYINDFILLKGKQYLISSAKDASINIFDIDSGKKLLSIYVVDLGKLIFVTPEYYYMATGDAITGLGYYHNGKVYPAEQFDTKYNRPDYVLEALDIFDKEIVDMYHLAYLKRIQKLGFTENMLDGELELPELKITNQKEIDLNTTISKTEVDLQLKDKNYNLDRLNVYVNEVPLFGTKGMDLRDRYSRETPVKVEIPLSSGKNVIQISCVNEKGIESLKEEFEVYYDNPNKVKPNLYLISLAVAEYKQSEYNLRYTINDGRGFVKLFSQQSPNFKEVIVDSLYNSNCVRENIFALKEKLLKTNPDDYVYIHIAGHGLLDDNLDWFFATSNIDFSDPSVNGLKYDEIENLLDSIPARNKMLLMDACHSGEVDKNEGVEIAEKADTDETRGVSTKSAKRKKTKNSLGNSFELMRLLFSDLKKGTGTVVISAASGGGYALENESIENGIFTYCLIDAFNKNKADKNKNKEISVSELRNFIFDGVNKLSEGKQQPTSRRENLQNDFQVK